MPWTTCPLIIAITWLKHWMKDLMIFDSERILKADIVHLKVPNSRLVKQTRTHISSLRLEVMYSRLTLVDHLT